jgi:hypothetical protein
MTLDQILALEPALAEFLGEFDERNLHFGFELLPNGFKQVDFLLKQLLCGFTNHRWHNWLFLAKQLLAK